MAVLRSTPGRHPPITFGSHPHSREHPYTSHLASTATQLEKRNKENKTTKQIQSPKTVSADPGVESQGFRTRQPWLSTLESGSGRDLSG